MTTADRVEAIARVAAAIDKAGEDACGDGSSIPSHVEMMNILARAAIAAMPEPTVTVGMVTAALSAVGEHEVSLSSYRRVEVTKMILAALAWRPSPPQKDEQP